MGLADPFSFLLFFSLLLLVRQRGEFGVEVEVSDGARGMFFFFLDSGFF